MGAGRTVPSLDHEGLARLIIDACNRQDELQPMAAAGNAFIREHLAQDLILGRYAERLESMASGTTTCEPAWDPRKQLDPTDVIGARNSVLSDTRSVTALALISAQQPKLALKQFLAEWLPDADTDQFSKIDWNVIWQKAKLISDPLSLMAFGRTIEECAVTDVKEQDPLRQVLLSQSLASYEQADKMVKETNIRITR